MWTCDELGVGMHPTYTYVLAEKDWRARCQAYRICVSPSLNSILLISKFNKQRLYKLLLNPIVWLLKGTGQLQQALIVQTFDY
jgi:hypothetical protein